MRPSGEKLMTASGEDETIAALGDFGHQHEKTADPAVRIGMRNILHLRVAGRPVPMGRRTLEPRQLASQRGLYPRAANGVSLRAEHLPNGSADDRLPAPPEPLLIGLVDEAIPFMPIDVGDHRRHGVGQLTHERRIGMEGRRVRGLGPTLGFGRVPPYAGAQPPAQLRILAFQGAEPAVQRRRGIVGAVA